MKKVFVHSINGTWTVIDKSSGAVIDRHNDILIFNAEYRRHKGTKGWHGIISDQINKSVIWLMQQKFSELIFKPNLYYPRLGTTVVKKAEVLRMVNGKTLIQGGVNHLMPTELVNKMCSKWNNSDFLDDDEEEDYEEVSYGWEEYNEDD